MDVRYVWDSFAKNCLWTHKLQKSISNMSSISKIKSALALTICAVVMSLPEVHSAAPIEFINCNAPVIGKDLSYATENGHISALTEINGTMFLFTDNDSSPKWLFYMGDFDIKSHTRNLGNLTDVRRTVLDLAYTLNEKKYCLRLSL
ncbi:uncharacterized protein LOC110832787 isoform X2 [Zootermopsis nevadensis]|uniref:uncharacterized protein LOC110832787 isoform X2 n=1 Tax=Zootermopsis nevadensis TaxID=136037 RepID=UPI000B8E65B6|nr:uncharacterized protein LOC110832787 isoform X2 [Zootermopsis nevadensis]